MNSPPLKYCSVLVFLFSVFFLAAAGYTSPLPPLQTVRWETDMNVAMTRAEREQRPLFLHFVGNDSSSAQQMGSEVFSQPNIASHLNANFVMVRINAVENSVLAQKYSITAIPTDLVLRPNGQIIHRRVGVIAADRFAQYLTFLQETIQAERNQAPSSPPPTQTNPFLNVNSQSPVQPVSPPPAMPSGTIPPSAPHQQSMISAVPSVGQDPFAQHSPAVQQSPMGHQTPTQHPPFAQPTPPVQMPPIATGTTAQSVASANNPLRGAEIAARPAWEQNVSMLNSPTPPPVPAATIQAMLGEPAPAKMTVEVPLALEGFCPIMLCTEERWVAGNPAFSTMFQEHIFRFSSREALLRFAQNPANYVPVAMGEDIVLTVDRNRRVNGDRRFGAWYQGRVFLFSSQETFDAFEASPEYYADIAVKYETARRAQPVPIVY